MSHSRSDFVQIAFDAGQPLLYLWEDLKSQKGAFVPPLNASTFQKIQHIKEKKKN